MHNAYTYTQNKWLIIYARARRCDIPPLYQTHTPNIMLLMMLLLLFFFCRRFQLQPNDEYVKCEWIRWRHQQLRTGDSTICSLSYIYMLNGCADKRRRDECGILCIYLSSVTINSCKTEWNIASCESPCSTLRPNTMRHLSIM